MKKVYQAGSCAPVSTYKAALRQHAKFKMARHVRVWLQPIGCSHKSGVNQWWLQPIGVNQWWFKQLIKNGKWIVWSGLQDRSKF